jgi:anti-sigma regulatory factor (Ser/Thr protein kinase)
VTPSRRASAQRIADELRTGGVLSGRPAWTRQFAFAATGASVPAARHKVEELGVQAGLRGNDLFELVLAAGEGLSNAVKHGSPRGEQDTVTVTVSCHREVVSVEIRDEGPGMLSSPLHPPEDASSEGRGIHVMRDVTDDIRFECDGGTCVLLVKRIPKRRAR